MYTQCPECGASFRVTADVLRQAAGKVRCGTCSAAFNALDFLSEDKPAAPVRSDPEPSLPELKPEPDELTADLEAPRRKMSAAQSAALLKTLDQLAGDDIRIEDTGVEWRVLADDEEEEDGDDDPATGVDFDVREATSGSDTDIDELLDATPTPVDQFLTETPDEVEAAEIFTAPGATVPDVETPAADDDAGGDTVLRFDDNTGLPDDFDFDAAGATGISDESGVAPAPDETVDARIPDDDVELDIGAADEWEDLLGEVELPAAVVASAPTDESDGTGADDVPAEPEFDLYAETGLALDDDDAPAGEADSGLEFGDDDGDGAADEPEPDDDAALVEFEFEFDGEAAADDDLRDEITLAGPVEEPGVRLDDEPEFEEAPPADAVVPPMSEAEETINMQIDEELFALSVEDDDGLRSTMVLDEDALREEVEDTEPADDAESVPPAPSASMFETIIMEGDSITASAAEEDAEANAQAARDSLAKHREADTPPPKRHDLRLIAAIGALAVVLLLQVLHQSRTALATNNLFNATVAPVYRALGKPVTPDWDVSGWRFEATRGTTDADNNVLSIVSRVGNASDAALPYPLISVALTDRFEDVIGSRVFEPAEYLGEGGDARQPVASGATFDAAIAIDSPGETATGFKLNVCYRQPDLRLRCALEDFR